MLYKNRLKSSQFSGMGYSCASNVINPKNGSQCQSGHISNFQKLHVLSVDWSSYSNINYPKCAKTTRS